MKRSTFISMSLAAIALTACSGHSVTVDPERSATTEDALRVGTPKPEWFRVPVAATAMQGAPPSQSQPPPESCAGGPPAPFAAMTADIMRNANGVLENILNVVGQVTGGPPALVEPGHAVWGPITSPTAPSVYRLDVAQVGPQAFHFQLSGRPKPGDESTWRGVFQGTVNAPDSTHRAGDAAVDFDNMHALDPASDPVAGRIAIQFQFAPDGRMLDQSFSGIAGRNAPTPNDAHYVFVAGQDGLRFDFVTRTDFDHDGTLDELVHIQSRWVAPGAGKASLTVTGGSLGPRQVGGIECWDPRQALVFYADDINAHPPAGSPACCVP